MPCAINGAGKIIETMFMKPVKSKKIQTGVFVFATLSIYTTIVTGADAPPATAEAANVDNSKWKCKYCEFQEGFSGEVEVGAEYVSDDSFKFGEYTGLKEKGAYFIGNATTRYRDEDAYYMDLFIRNLGLESRTISIEGGKQGKYKLFLRYDEIPHYITETAQTPYLGTGSNSLTLPSSWVPASTTTGMTDLTSSLHQVDLETKRKRVDLGMAYTPTSKWEYKLKYRHEVKDGQVATAGAFLFSAAQLIKPVDYKTDQVDASVFYNSEKTQASLAYYGSFFKNNNDSLTWENPYTSAFGADSGQLALAPDNQFNQFVLSGGFHIGEGTLASAEVAMGRMEQNENFLPYTTNIPLDSSLSSNSLGGIVDTLNANIKLVSRLSEKWHLHAAYLYNDHDNKTPQLTFNSPVATDSIVTSPRTTLPYSFTENDFKINADYRVVRSTKLSFGYDYDSMERTYQEVDKTKENTVWATATVRALDTDMIVRLARGVRDVSNYTPVPEIQPPENPLLRKYNMADRDRLLSKMHFSFLPYKENLTIGLSVDYAMDDYTDSQIGLTDGSELSVHADAAMMIGESTHLHFFVGQQQIESSQAGSQTFSTPDWYANNNDTITSAGVGFTQGVTEQLDVGVDFTLSRSVGEVTVTSSGSPSVFPDNVTNLNSLKLYANYQLKESMSLYLGYWYESYDSSNWSIDGVTPDTIPNVLALGVQSPSYDVSVIAASLRYKF
jgi:MtrB/PioB family decaheme-associated outer membrane protein